MFYKMRVHYNILKCIKELKSISQEHYETMKDFRLKMGSHKKFLWKAYELSKKVQLSRHNKITLTYEIYLNYFYNDDGIKNMIINNYGMETYNIFLRAAELDKKSSEATPSYNDKMSESHDTYAKEIQKYLVDLGCSFTKTGYIAAMALKKDRSALDQAISFCVGAIVENYSKNSQLIMSEHVHLKATSNKIKNYYENGQISKLAYQSSISIIGSCLNLNKTDEEKAVIESLINQNYLGSEKLVSITLAIEENEKNHRKDYMLELMKEDRFKSNGLSKFEKLFIDRNLSTKSSFSNDDKDSLVNFVFNEFRADLPITREEIRSYINERLGTGESGLQTNTAE